MIILMTSLPASWPAFWEGWEVPVGYRPPFMITISGKGQEANCVCTFLYEY